MSKADWLNLFSTATIIVGCLMPLGILPHIFKMRKERSSKGQSALGAGFYVVCSLWWSVYAGVFSLLPVLIPNIFGVLVGIFWVYYIKKFE
jgi:hypothetical protein